MVKQTERIRVLLVDDHPVIRDGIRFCLENAPHLEVAGEAADGQEALRAVPHVAPDLIMMDVNMPRLNGLQATMALREKDIKTPVLILTMHDHPEYILEIIRAGACGYVSKDASPDELIRAIEDVAAGGMHFNPEDVMRYVRRYAAAPNRRAAAPVTALSPREHEVLTLAAQGMTNRAIAERMKVGVRSVETYRERLMRKLDLHDAAALRHHAAAHHLLNSRKCSDRAFGN